MERTQRKDAPKPTKRELERSLQEHNERRTTRGLPLTSEITWKKRHGG